MENIQFKWDEDPTQPQSTPKWEPPTQDTQQVLNWEESSSNPEPVLPPTLPSSLEVNRQLNKYTYGGFFSKMEIGVDYYNLYFNNEKLIENINNSNLTPADQSSPGKYNFDPQPNTELGDLIHTLVKIGKDQNLKLSNCNVYKSTTDGNSYNISSNSALSFVYVLDCTPGLDFLNFDFASLNGPVIKVTPLVKGSLFLSNGWIPTAIYKTSQDPLTVITGDFSKP